VSAYITIYIRKRIMIAALNVENRLSDSTDEVKRTIDIVWSAYRSVLSKEGHLAYVSTAISSGKLMYDILQQIGCSYEELKQHHSDVLYEQIIKPNIDQGTFLARNIASNVDEPVVSPAIFEARSQRWSQDEYMGMWLRMIEENVGRMVMSPGWEYSNGGTEEYLLAIQMIYGLRTRWNINVEDHEGTRLPLPQGMELIAKALLYLHDQGQKAQTIASVYVGLNNTHTAWGHMERGTPFNREMMSDKRSIYSCNREVLSLLRADYGIETQSFSVSPGKGLDRELTALPEHILILPKLQE